MNNRILKICYTVFLAVLLVCIILLAVHNVRLGMNTMTSRLILALYVALALYAVWRIFTLVKDILKKS